MAGYCDRRGGWSAPAGLGRRLRRSRESAGVSIRGLAEETDLSVSMLAKVERGDAMPSLPSLLSIVSCLGASLDEVVLDARKVKARPFPMSWCAPTDGPVLRSGRRLGRTLGNGVREELLTASPDSLVEFVGSVYPVAGAPYVEEPTGGAAAAKYGVVVEGRCTAVVGRRSYPLGRGDSIAVDPSSAYAIRNVGRAPVRVVWVTVRSSAKSGRDRGRHA